MFGYGAKAYRNWKLTSGRKFEVAAWLILALLAVGLTLGAFAQAARAQGGHAQGVGQEIPFTEAEIFFELNNTGGDPGIHGKLNGAPL